MKKLLVLLMVFGIAAGAQAVILGDVDYSYGGSDFAFDGSIVGGKGLSGDFAAEDKAYTITLEGTGDVTFDWSGATFAPLMFGNGVNEDLSSSTFVRVSGGDFNAKAAGSDLFDGLLINGTSGTVTFTDLETDATGTVNVVPEPMTIGLLGIGGLFLRRRFA